MRLTKEIQQIDMKETDLAQGIIDHFSDQYDDIYKEVDSIGGGICDIVLKRGKLIVAIEAKTSFTLKVIYQAYRHREHASYCYVAVPWPKKVPNFDALDICKALGIGVLYFDSTGLKGCKEALPPVYNRYIRTFTLKEYQKRSVAGSVSDRLTDFKITIEDIERIIKRKGGSMPVTEVINNPFHYSSTSVARRCIVDLCRRGVVKNFRFEKGFLILI